jgi:hypothetical protein
MSISETSAKILSVTFTDRLITVRLSDGRIVSNPLEWYPRLHRASPAERNAFEISGGGYGVHWEDLDEDLSALGLAQGVPSVEYRKSTGRLPRGAGGVPPRPARRLKHTG